MTENLVINLLGLNHPGLIAAVRDLLREVARGQA